MRAATRLIGAAAAMLTLAGGLAAQGRGGRGGGGAPPGPGPCDRPCLEGFVNQYPDALVAHNAFGLPLAQKVKFSENDQLLDLGDGLWNVTSDIGKYKLYATDMGRRIRTSRSNSGNALKCRRGSRLGK